MISKSSTGEASVIDVSERLAPEGVASDDAAEAEATVEVEADAGAGAAGANGGLENAGSVDAGEKLSGPSLRSIACAEEDAEIAEGAGVAVTAGSPP